MWLTTSLSLSPSLSFSSLELELSWDPVSYYHLQARIARKSLALAHGEEEMLFVVNSTVSRIGEEFVFEDCPHCELTCVCSSFACALVVL